MKTHFFYSQFLSFLHICHTLRFQITKQLFIFGKTNLKKYKMQLNQINQSNQIKLLK